MVGIVIISVIMSSIKFIVSIPGIIICIRSKNRLSKVGTIFFMLYIIQFVYFWIKMLVIDRLFMTHMISGEELGRYMEIANVPEALFDTAARILIIIGVLKVTSIEYQKGKANE
ncbi:hypothetical protein SAMN02745751_03625 [Dethiosulfatibacter aminovorans DSM 17477]|uniref:Lycopene cyclase domain-containing protein n=1 Tax=Dethiosulfatibacter aminovorans DSM 17477 TaxID=1121476 RepID=A0A1M6MXJ4_9FIRM|nr:hypothetical protein [Dethiosulfatibacter aminovorans]SHJ88165.1 hypothetical protein SAMN02745751_03625 [Dethiosulfatibacter aminovorans DSM 17477]